MVNFKKYIFFILLLVLAIYAYCILSDPFPLTIREGAAIAPIFLMLKGHNLYDLNYLPAYYNAYVFIQEYITFPVAHLFGMNLIVFRILGQVFILLTCFLFFKAAYKLSDNRSLSFLVTVILYSGYLYLNTPESRADAYGVFFYMSAITSYLFFDNKIWRITILIAAGLLGLFTKYYFIAAVPIALTYEILIFSGRRLVNFILIGVVLSALSVVLISKFLPGYYPVYLQPFLVSGTLYKKDLLFSFKQFFVFLILISPLTIGITALLRKRLIADFPLRFLFSRHNFERLSIAEKRESYLFWGLITSTAGTILFLATNIGNQMTYLFHLMLPWYLLSSLFLYKKFSINENRFYSLGVICLSFFVLFLRPWNYFTKTHGNWKKIYSYIDKSNRIFASAVFADYIIRSNKTLYNSGHTEFFQATSEYRDDFKSYTQEDSVLIRNLKPEILETSRRYYKTLNEYIADKKFDLIILDNTSGIGNYYERRIRMNYRKIDSASLYLPHSRHLILVEIFSPVN